MGIEIKKHKIALKCWVKKPLQNPTFFRQERVQELSDIQLGMEEVEITKPHLALEQATQTTTTLSFR